MVKQDLIQYLIDEGFSRSEAARAVNLSLNFLADAIGRREEIYLRGFGTFLPHTAAPKKARDFHNGKVLPIPAKNVVKFKPSLHIKAILNDR